MEQQLSRDGVITVEGTCPACHNRCSINYTLEDGALTKRKYQCTFCAKGKPAWGRPWLPRNSPDVVAKAVEFARELNEKEKGGEKMSYKNIDGWVLAQEVGRAKARSKITVYEQIKALGLETRKMPGRVMCRSRRGKRYSVEKKELMYVRLSDVPALEKKLDTLRRLYRRRQRPLSEPKPSPEPRERPEKRPTTNLAMTMALRTLSSAARFAGVSGKIVVDIDTGDASYFVSEVKLTEKKVKL